MNLPLNIFIFIDIFHYFQGQVKPSLSILKSFFLNQIFKDRSLKQILSFFNSNLFSFVVREETEFGVALWRVGEHLGVMGKTNLF